MVYNQISSTQNPVVKRILQLREKSRTRKKEGCFVIEGKRELQLANKGGYNIHELFFAAKMIPESELKQLLKDFHPNIKITELTPEVYQKLAYRGSSEGVIAIAQSQNLTLANLKLNKPNPLILVAESPEKPGNIGALLRTADAAGVDAVLIANPRTDLYNPNIIRSSVGCVFTTKIALGSTSEIIDYLKSHQIAMYAAALQASVGYHTIDYTTSSALVVGTEATGLSKQWREHSTKNIIIPMTGEIDSMNVSVAAGILVFEACRQRNFQ